jgi:hypothetical protein
LFGREAGELIAPPLDKTDGQIHRANISSLAEGEGKNSELKKPIVGRRDSAVPVEKARY